MTVATPNATPARTRKRPSAIAQPAASPPQPKVRPMPRGAVIAPDAIIALRLTENPKKPGNKNHPWFQAIMDTVAANGGRCTANQALDLARTIQCGPSSGTPTSIASSTSTRRRRCRPRPDNPDHPRAGRSGSARGPGRGRAPWQN
jgi:hypothetical protein